MPHHSMIRSYLMQATELPVLSKYKKASIRILGSRYAGSSPRAGDVLNSSKSIPPDSPKLSRDKSIGSPASISSLTSIASSLT